MGLYRGAARLGAPPRVRPLIRRSTARDRRTALELAGPYLGAKYMVRVLGQDAVLPDGDTFRQPFEELRDRFVLGSPEECFEQLRPCWEEVGANFLILRTHWSGMPASHSLASMRLMSDELLPALRKIGAR
jgi:alkanesulfonate monooxygenase SsuD/methylene tetrahydromethanopterin reductase-like flavin-dependent oxidoreductase (luciferase family)